MRRFLAAFLFSLLPLPLIAEQADYASVRRARPDGRVVAVQNFTIERDAFRFRFDSGAFHLLAPKDGRTFGAVFLGNGSYELTPANVTERNHLRLTSKDDAIEKLSDRFTSLVVLFTDKTFTELTNGRTVATQSPDAAATTAYDEYLKQQKLKYQANLHLRVTAELLNRPDAKEGLFLAMFDGAKYPPMLAAVDPLGVGNLSARFADFGGEEVALYCADDQEEGFWYLSATKGTLRAGSGKPIIQLVDAQHYAVDTKLDGKNIEGTATIRLIPLADRVRVVPVRILPALMIREAHVAGSNAELDFVQEDISLGRVAKLFKDEVGDGDAALVFRTPPERGKPIELVVSYKGDDVVFGVGPDIFSVRARDSWYPNLGTFNDLATYELTFRHSPRYDVVAIGKKTSEKVADKEKVTVWNSGIPVRVAGFNYGKFVKTARKDDTTGLTVNVYTNRDWKERAGDAAIDAMNAARVGYAFFGQPPHNEVSVTQQAEWSFGQSWPSLVFLPTLALTTQTERAFVFEGDGDSVPNVNVFAESVGWHELAHQWWGHQVGWESYRDQWLSEGFAEFSAALTLQVTGGGKKYAMFWKERRDDLFGNRGLVPNNDAGPISQGYRLVTQRTPGAYSAVVYGKGGYVLHMLRMLMRDTTKQNPDEQFTAMMKDFTATWGGKSPSTADFKKVAERYIPPAADVSGNGKLDWFFDQWVHGTEVPKLKSTLTASASSGGKYRISGSVSQSGVSESFATVVPLYVSFGGDKISRIAFLRLIGSKPQVIDAELALPSAPKAIVVNAMDDVLVRD